MEYHCPNCQTKLEWDTNNEFRPFCSARCKNNDLVMWANEKNRIAGDEHEDYILDQDLD